MAQPSQSSRRPTFCRDAWTARYLTDKSKRDKMKRKLAEARAKRESQHA